MAIDDKGGTMSPAIPPCTSWYGPARSSPTAVILKQQSGWTYGVLANQIWSFANAGGPNHRPEVNQMFLQPFLAYTWKDSTTLTLNSESTFYWDTQERSVPSICSSVTSIISASSR